MFHAMNFVRLIVATVVILAGIWLVVSMVLASAREHGTRRCRFYRGKRAWIRKVK